MEESTPIVPSSSLLSINSINNIFTHAQENFLLISQYGQILLVNNFACQSLGYSRSELMNNQIQHLIINSCTPINITIDGSLENNTHITEEGLAIDKAGSLLPIEYTIFPCEKIGDTHVLFICLIEMLIGQT
jgi:PAS domain S-box-containing protein